MHFGCTTGPLDEPDEGIDYLGHAPHRIARNSLEAISHLPLDHGVDRLGISFAASSPQGRLDLLELFSHTDHGRIVDSQPFPGFPRPRPHFLSKHFLLGSHLNNHLTDCKDFIHM